MQGTDIIVLRQIVMLTLLGLTGFFAGKTKYLPENSGVILSRIVVKLTAPILIVTTMIGYNFTKQTILNGLWIFLFGIIFILISGAISVAACKALKIQGAASNIYKMLSMFGNVMFMAYPLLSSIYKEEGIIYAIFFNIANDAVLWTLGIYLVNKHKNNTWRENIKHLINGNTVAFTAGIIFIATNLSQHISSNAAVNSIYTVLFDTFSPLGKTTIYLSMLFIGLILSEIKIQSFSDMLKRYPLFILSFVKMLIVPVLACVIMSFAAPFLNPMVKAIVVLQLAMPSATIVSALASQYGSDYKFATEGVFVTTVLSVLTLPVMVYVLGIFG
ncbi:hypothetical protein DFR58_109162 [Anaerobacterium chartisolvens]|uniref:Permease n=1 Tax=Anaerobacterium chartisolvens TaxID=1297424 RepID=A0A369BB90_9FIRM|nr:hypothetical protein DFR58_109162 [Anaerobacterium chartisolvens]